MSKANQPFEVVHCLPTSVGEEVVNTEGNEGEVGSFGKMNKWDKREGRRDWVRK